MTHGPKSVEAAAREWFKDPAFAAAYDALGAEFASASARMAAHGKPDTAPGARNLPMKRRAAIGVAPRQQAKPK